MKKLEIKHENVCRTCRSWDELESQEGVGRCRKNPPIFNKRDNRFVTGEWPTTCDNDWCDRYLWRGTRKE